MLLLISTRLRILPVLEFLRLSLYVFVSVSVTLTSRMQSRPCSHKPQIRTSPMFSVFASGLHAPSLVAQHRLIFGSLRTTEGVLFTILIQ
jgi:hypothetical protein